MTGLSTDEFLSDEICAWERDFDKRFVEAGIVDCSEPRGAHDGINHRHRTRGPERSSAVDSVQSSGSTWEAPRASFSSATNDPRCMCFRVNGSDQLLQRSYRPLRYSCNPLK